MKKIYKATYEASVVFFTEQENDVCLGDESVLRSEARRWIKKEDEQNGFFAGSLVVSELKGLDDLPKGWSLDSLPWGEIEVCADECTIGVWFENQQEERLAKIDALKAEIAKLTDELNSLVEQKPKFVRFRS
jgi:hypothetical protein